MRIEGKAVDGVQSLGSGPESAFSPRCLTQSKFPHQGMLCGASHILSHISDAFKWIFFDLSHTPRKAVLALL